VEGHLGFKQYIPLKATKFRKHLSTRCLTNRRWENVFGIYWQAVLCQLTIWKHTRLFWNRWNNFLAKDTCHGQPVCTVARALSPHKGKWFNVAGTVTEQEECSVVGNEAELKQWTQSRLMPFISKCHIDRMMREREREKKKKPK
jgi:hypothetical protein